jgi:meso-butanediol dehydrogenase/(S,S)-butanediol dehydrogenase/diacetyl reductase
MNQSVAQEVAEFGITANVYSPGVIDTRMWDQIDHDITERLGAPLGTAFEGMLNLIPANRHGLPSEVASVVSFLAREDSSYVTGQSIVVDGGLWFS